LVRKLQPNAMTGGSKYRCHVPVLPPRASGNYSKFILTWSHYLASERDTPTYRKRI